MRGFVEGSPMFGASARLATMLALSALASAAEAEEQLYRATLIVTGQRVETRAPAIAEAFKEVLAKVSGDQRLLADPQAAKLAAEAETAVRAARYRDRLEHLPVHDEQGTRDRPHDLTVDFVPERIDALLRDLGRRPWPAPRPRIAVVVTWRNGDETGVLTADGERGSARREALEAASRRVGVQVVLPDEKDLAVAGLTAEELPAARLARLDPLARTINGDRALAGSMIFSEEDHGWVTEWRLAVYGETLRWRVRGVNFDEAFRNGLRGAAQVLSGHGPPGSP